MFMLNKRQKQKLESIKLALKYTYQASPLLSSTIFLVSIFGGVIGLATPYFFKLIIDHVLTNQSESAKLSLTVLLLLGSYGFVRVVQGAFWNATSVLRRMHLLRMEKYANYVLMQKISSLDVIYFEDPEYYNTLSRASTNLFRLNEIFFTLSFYFGEVLSISIILFTLGHYDWKIVLLIIIGVLPSLYLALKSSRMAWSAFEQSSPIYREANYYRYLLTERPEVVKEIRTFGLKEYFLKKFDSLFGDFIQKQDRVGFQELKWYLFTGLFEAIFSVIAAILVVNSFLLKKITLGDLTFLWALLFQFAQDFRGFIRTMADVNNHATFLTPFVELMGFESKIKESSNPKPFPKVLKQGIEFKNVSFYYPNAKRASLKNVSFKLDPKESVALVGENGSGKTTLIKLLCRLYDVSGGEVLIDGINIKEFRLKDLYQNLGVIFQDFVKYEGLIEENIFFGDISRSSKEEVHRAAVKSEAWEFIRQLEKRYKTHVGKTLKEEGIDLSVGQWQKVALARAFFRNAQLLILDEPTAAVDAKAEYELFRKFEHLTKGKLTFLISHRFSTVRMAHKILVMDKGRIIESGSHEELIKRKGNYARLFNLQASGYR